MKFFYALMTAVPLAAAYITPPPGPAAPLSPTDCSAWVLVTTGMTCTEIETTYQLTATQFLALNPVSGTSCTLLVGFAYCLKEGRTETTSSIAVSTTTFVTSTSTQAATTTSSGNGITTPSLIQPGLVSNCNAFHLVVSGDSCGAISTAAGISLENFYSWNPTVGKTCASLWLGYEVCIGVIGSSPTTMATTTTTAGNGIVTPTPYQAGMTTSCDAFHFVVSGDECGAIATAAGISLTDFYSWNPAVGNTCASLWAANYVCIGIIGHTPTRASPTTTAAGNGVATPTPYQPGMTTNCRKFHLVVSGDECGAIAAAAGIALSDFYSWNPTVGATCATLWLGYYVCIATL